MTDTTEHLDVELTLNGETRTITVSRFSPQHCWYAQCAVLVKCRTGTKLHRRANPQVVLEREQWHWGYTRIHQRLAIPVRWADDHPGSGWN